MSATTITPTGQHVLEEVIRHLSAAAYRAQVASSTHHDVSMGALALGAQLVVSQALDLLPPGADVDEPIAGDVSALELVRAAEALTRTVPIEDLPRGTSEVIVALCDLIREHG